MLEIIKQLKNNESWGKIGIFLELIKEGGEPLEREKIPKKWSEGIIIPIFKKEFQQYLIITEEFSA